MKTRGEDVGPRMMDFNLLSLNFRENPQKFSLEIPDNQQASESFITLIDPEITDTLRFKYLYMIKKKSSYKQTIRVFKTSRACAPGLCFKTKAREAFQGKPRATKRT